VDAGLKPLAARMNVARSELSVVSDPVEISDGQIEGGA